MVNLFQLAVVKVTGLSNLSKYITKNEIESYRLPWHCSRNVSSLFTTINYEGDLADFYLDQLPESSIHDYMKDEEYDTNAGFKFRSNEKIYYNLDRVIELIGTRKNIDINVCLFAMDVLCL
jgi:hypothetical protein